MGTDTEIWCLFGSTIENLLMAIFDPLRFDLTGQNANQSASQSRLFTPPSPSTLSQSLHLVNKQYKTRMRFSGDAQRKATGGPPTHAYYSGQASQPPNQGSSNSGGAYGQPAGQSHGHGSSPWNGGGGAPLPRLRLLRPAASAPARLLRWLRPPPFRSRRPGLRRQSARRRPRPAAQPVERPRIGHLERQRRRPIPPAYGSYAQHQQQRDSYAGYGRPHAGREVRVQGPQRVTEQRG